MNTIVAKSIKSTVVLTEQQTWAEYNAQVESEVNAAMLDRAAMLAPYIKQMLPGQAVQIFGMNEYGEVCKCFGIIHRDQKISTQLGVLSVNVAVASWETEHHECVGYEDCAIDRILRARDAVVELGVEEIFEIKIQSNRSGAFYQIKLDRDFEA